jgi:hypothetical protein
MNGFERLDTGELPKKLYIGGRPRPGQEESYTLLEQPGPPVRMHWSGKFLTPHWKLNCPNCTGEAELKPMWYIGACSPLWGLIIVELTELCYRSAEMAARHVDANGFYEEMPQDASFAGLVVKIGRGSRAASPRWLRCDERKRHVREWPYQTRHELARIWGIPANPKLYEAENA